MTFCLFLFYPSIIKYFNGFGIIPCTNFISNTTCNKCFIKDWNLVKKIHEPIFPYSSDMEEEYFENPNHMHWEKDKNIIKYIEDTKKMLINCPLC